MYWDKQEETRPRAERTTHQREMLRQTLKRAAQSPYYGAILKKIDLETTDPLALLSDIPFTEKQNLRDYFPYGFLTVPLTELVRLHSSSGTTGTPTVVFYTRNDIEQWSDLLARSMYMTGVRPGDVFQNMMGYGLFTGGLGFHYGAEKLGMLTIPSGPGNSKRQIWFMQTFKTTVIHILPSYALHLMAYFRELDIKPGVDTQVKVAFIGAEPHTAETRQKIEDFYQIKAYNSYGLSEICGPGVAFECPAQQGMHIWEDHFLVEIIDPHTGAIRSDGEEGELVITTLQKEGMPLLRYRTRDLTTLTTEPCSCGRTHARIARIKGRTDDMLIINGVNIFPMQIEKALMGIPEVGAHYIIEIHKQNFMDKLVVKVELSEQFFSGSLPDLEHLQHQLIEQMRTELVVTPIVKLVEPGSLPVSEGKAKRVYDYRNNELSI